MKTHFAAALGSVALTAGTLLVAPAPAVAQTPASVREFNVPDGVGSYARGTLTWSNRWVGVEGTLRAVDCRRAWFGAYDASHNKLDDASTGTKCNTTYPLNADLSANKPGGAAYVIVCIDDANANPLNCVRYNRP